MLSKLPAMLLPRHRVLALATLSTLPYIGLQLSKFLQRRNTLAYNERAVAFVTGCDTGLGYSMAILCKQTLDLHVIATCVNAKSAGAKELSSLGVDVLELDLTCDASIDQCYKYVEEYLESNRLELKLFVNNAATMSFGEFDWRPMDHITQEFQVNLLGPMRLTKLFLNLILPHKTRVVNICSHCSLETLPGLVPYAMTKTALLAWTNGLRVELDKYGVKVVAVIPGSFYTQSSIMSRPRPYLDAMRQEVAGKSDVIREMYGEYFNDYVAFVANIAQYSRTPDEPLCIEDKDIMGNIRNAFVHKYPRALYQCDNQFRYKFYHSIFRLLPVCYLKDWLLIKFMQMPKYKGK